jgi:hypothetical protein
MTTQPDRRLVNLRTALDFLQLPARAPELRLLHRWLDSWTGLGLVVVGVERHGLRFSLSHIGEHEWRAYFMSSQMFAPQGFGVASDDSRREGDTASQGAKPAGRETGDSTRTRDRRPAVA